MSVSGPPSDEDARGRSARTLIERALAVGQFLWHIPSLVLIGLVRVYQWTLSPIVGRQCRFHPTCSNYFIQAVEKYGAVRGTWRGLWRILRCNPLHPGGNDPP